GSAVARRPGASTAWPGPADQAAPVRPRAGGYASWRGFSSLGALPRHAEHARQVSLDSLTIARGGRAAGRAMVAADRDQPVLSRRVLLAQNRRGHCQVAVGVEQLAGLAVAVPLVAQVDLSQAAVDAGRRHFAQGLTQ